MLLKKIYSTNNNIKKHKHLQINTHKDFYNAKFEGIINRIVL